MMFDLEVAVIVSKLEILHGRNKYGACDYMMGTYQAYIRTVTKSCKPFARIALMPPKREPKKDTDSLTGVVVVDSYDPRFAPFSKNGKPWCLFPICNVPIINFTLAWIARTEVQKVLLVVSENAVHSMEKVERDWKHCFESISIVSCKNAMNVGDALRELDTRGLLAGDFLLVSNPATITSSALQAQIAAYRERRAENKNNVMTLIYSDSKAAKNAVVAVEKSTKKLKAYHRKEEPTQLDIDKSFFIGDAVIRQDIVDSGIALCSLNISTQFSDNFDFQHRDDVIREILVNEEILLQNIHVDVLPSYEAALCVTDYDTLLLVNTLIMERWFYPLVLDKMVSMGSCGFNALQGNIYVTVNKSDTGKLSPSGSVSKQAFDVTLGLECDIDDTVVLRCATIGNGTKIGPKTQIYNCIIGDNCVIGANCRLEELVLGDNVSISDGTHVQKQSVISAKVNYPHDLDVPSNVAICSCAPHEDFEEAIHCEEMKGVYMWSLSSGGSFWATNGRADSGKGSMGEENESALGSDSEGAEPVELDATGQFYEEVVESMERIHGFTFSNQQMHNLILEINSSKLAYNISMEDVAKYVFSAFLGLPGNETWTGLKELSQKWKLLFSNYYKPRKSQIQLLLAIEDRFKESPTEFGKLVTRLVHFLYNEMDILEEEAILEWAATLDEDSDLKRIMKPIVDWLQEDSGEESED